VPGRLRGLTDVDESGPGGQEALELGVLTAVGGVDVDVQPGMPVLRFVVADEEDKLADTACYVAVLRTRA
jgi:hypothetical protein